MKTKGSNHANQSPLRDLEDYIHNFDAVSASKTTRSTASRVASPSYFSRSRTGIQTFQIKSVGISRECLQSADDSLRNVSLEKQLEDFIDSIEKTRKLRTHKRRTLIRNMFADIDWDDDFEDQHIEITTRKTDLTEEEFQALLLGVDSTISVPSSQKLHMKKQYNFTASRYNRYSGNPDDNAEDDVGVSRSGEHFVDDMSTSDAKQRLRRIAVELEHFEKPLISQPYSLREKSDVQSNFYERDDVEKPPFLVNHSKREVQKEPRIADKSLSSIHQNPSYLETDIEGNIDLISLAKVSFDPAFDGSVQSNNLRTPIPKTPKHAPIFT